VYGADEVAAERDRYFDRCVARGGNPEAIKVEFADLWKDR
jgi:hypothetical protein